MNASSEAARYYQTMRQRERTWLASPARARSHAIMEDIDAQMKREMAERYPRPTVRSMTDEESWAMDEWRVDRYNALMAERGVLSEGG